tara:strand:+ start:2949 stop:3683 length:735 start_codon:yes stop_codon:yes gene_type:complete
MFGIDYLQAKLIAGEKLTVSHVGVTKMDGFTDDGIRIIDLEHDLKNRLDQSVKLEQTKISFDEGNNFLEGAGHGADVVVLHRIPNVRIAKALRVAGLEPEVGFQAEGHTLENWINAIIDSGAHLVYIWGSGATDDFHGWNFQHVPGYEMLGDWNQDGKNGSGQFAVLKKIYNGDHVIGEIVEEDAPPQKVNSLRGFTDKFTQIDPAVFQNIIAESTKKHITDPLQISNFINSNLKTLDNEDSPL